MAELYLIRHGKTYGNTLGRYIGTTDEELCEEGREALKRLKAGRDFAAVRPGVVYASPLKRCVQTAEILFPEIPVLPLLIRSGRKRSLLSATEKQFMTDTAIQTLLETKSLLFHKHTAEGNGIREVSGFCAPSVSGIFSGRMSGVTFI